MGLLELKKHDLISQFFSLLFQHCSASAEPDAAGASEEISLCPLDSEASLLLLSILFFFKFITSIISFNFLSIETIL